MEETVRTLERDAPGDALGEASWDVFLSYAAADFEWVKKLEAGLKSLGLRIFDPYAVPAQFWGRNRDEVVARVFPAECPVAFIASSAAYSRSDQCGRELAIIAGAAHDGASCLLLPGRLDDSPIPDEICSLAVIDLQSGSTDSAAALINATRREWISINDRHRRARNLDAAMERSRSWENPFRDLDAPLGGPSVPVPRTPNHEDVERVKHALEGLPRNDRQFIQWHYVDGLTLQDLADKLAISDSGARLRLRGILSRLGAIIDDERRHGR